MKKIITLLFCLACSLQSLFTASVFTIGVPQQLFDQKSSLMIYMVDQDGTQSVGKCHLDDICKRKIFQNQLEITTPQEEDCLDVIVDLMDFQATKQDLILLHFEFENIVQILRVLVVKDSFLEEDLFDVLTFPCGTAVQNQPEFNDVFDPLSDLVDNVDSQVVQRSIQQQEKISKFKEYMLYVKIYMLMQYGSMKRAMNSWLSCSY